MDEAPGAFGQLGGAFMQTDKIGAISLTVSRAAQACSQEA